MEKTRMRKILRYPLNTFIKTVKYNKELLDHEIF